jgi:hypothetical protein
MQQYKTLGDMMPQPPFRLYCERPTKYLFEQIQAQIQIEEKIDLTQDTCLKRLCDAYIKDHPIKYISEVTPLESAH